MSKKISQMEISITKTAEQWIGIQEEIKIILPEDNAKASVDLFNLSNEISSGINKLVINEL